MQDGKDTNNYTSTSSRIKKIRYTIAVIFIIFVIFAVFSYREDLTVENFRYLMKFVDVRPVSFGSAENAQINFESDSSTVASSFKEDLVVVSKTAVKIYDLSSKEILSDDVTLMRPAVSSSHKYFAVYDIGSKYVGIYNSFSKLWENDFEYPVYDVALDNKGNFCVITASKGYTSALKLYNNSFENVFNWRSADKYALSADLFSESDNLMAVGTVRNNTMGDMVSSLVILSSKEEKPIATIDFESEMVVKTEFNSKGNIIFLTDKALRFFNKKGKLLTETFFNSKALRKLETGDEYTVLILNENLVGKNHKVFVFDESGNTYMDRTVSSEITDVALSDSFVFILGVEDVTVIDIDTKKLKNYPAERSYRSVELFDEENVYLVYDGLAVAVGVQ